MKRMGLLPLAGLLCAGCAGIAPNQGARYEVDDAHVAAVERAARHSGVQVYWVNYPQKKAGD